MAVLGLVLAGGQSRRMGERDKALVLLRGQRMVARAVTRLRPQVSGLVISSNGDARAFADLGVSVIADEIAGFQGPLAGIAAGMRYAREHGGGATHLLSVSTDTPFLPLTLREDLERGCGDGQGAAVAASRENVHWVVGLWPVAALAAIEAALGRGERKVAHVLGKLDASVVRFGDVRMGGEAVDPFFNVNTPEDLAYAEAVLARRGVPVIGIAGWSVAGKTTLTCRLIEAMTARGVRVASVKHSHHAGPKAGAETDSVRHAKAGSQRVAFVSPTAWGIEPDITTAPEPPLSHVIEALGDVDLVIVEGMKSAPIPKIEVRSGAPTAERPQLLGDVIAIASDAPAPDATVPVFRRDDVDGLVRLILREFGL